MKTEKRLYQPRIKNERIRQLYALKQETSIPMTRLLDGILESYFAQKSPERSGMKKGRR